MNAVESCQSPVEVRVREYERANSRPVARAADDPAPKMYKKAVRYQIVPMQNSQYSAIRSSVLIRAPISAVLRTYVDTFSFIGADRSSRELTAIYTAYTLYFASKADEARYFDIQPVSYRIHMFNYSPAPFITPHREFFIEAQLSKTPAGYRICQTYAKRFLQQSDKTITGDYKCGLIEFAAVSETATEITQFVHAEPNGNVPAQLYNLVLERGNELLLLLKHESERGVDVSAGNSFDSQ